MKSKLLVAACALLVFAVAADAKDLQLLDNPIRVQALQARAIMWNGDGTVTPTSDWKPVGPSSAGDCAATNVWDCFEADDAGDGTCDPVDVDPGCGLGSSRWFYGPSYCNMFAVNDTLTVEADFATQTVFGWYWYGDGGAGPEACLVALFTGDYFDDTCTDGYTLGAGWIFDFGDLETNPGSYYICVPIDLAPGGFDMYNNGAVGGILANAYDGEYIYLATCAQFMLWGTDANRAGSQGPVQYDDDNPPDGTHDPATECYDYALGLCPDPLGAMMAFGGEGGGCPATGDEMIKKAKCKKGKLKVSVANGVLGSEFTISETLSGKSAVGVFDSKGKGKVTIKGLPTGSGTANAEFCQNGSDSKAFSCPA